MRLKFGKNTSKKEIGRQKKKARIRKKVHGTAERPRMCVFRSTHNIYVQVIDDMNHKTICATSSLKLNMGSNCEAAKAVGTEIAKIAKEKSIEKVVFDRNGFIYHGRIKALAEAAREAGLQF